MARILMLDLGHRMSREFAICVNFLSALRSLGCPSHLADLEAPFIFYSPKSNVWDFPSEQGGRTEIRNHDTIHSPCAALLAHSIKEEF
jgi:hypothetical protein